MNSFQHVEYIAIFSGKLNNRENIFRGSSLFRKTSFRETAFGVMVFGEKSDNRHAAFIGSFGSFDNSGKSCINNYELYG